MKADKIKPSLKSSKKKIYKPIYYKDWCKGCGLCVEFCPKSVFERDETGKPVIKEGADCSGCRFCEMHCPDFAIFVSECGEERGE